MAEIIQKANEPSKSHQRSSRCQTAGARLSRVSPVSTSEPPCFHSAPASPTILGCFLPPTLWPGRQSAADLAIWRGATSVCQLCHKYTAHRAAEAFMMSLPGAVEVS